MRCEPPRFDHQNLEHKPVILLLGDLARLHFSRVHTLLSKIGVYRGQPPILVHLCKKDGLMQKELADALNLTPPTITDTLQRMEKAGLLERRTDPEDGRISRVYITEKGRMVKRQVDEIIKEIDEETFKGLTEEEKKLFRQLVLKMIDNLVKSGNP